MGFVSKGNVMKKLILWSILLMTVSCSSTQKERNVPSEEKVLRLSIETEPISLDPRRANVKARLVVGMLFDGLTRLDQDGESVPAVAEKITVSEDGLHYTFHLRKVLLVQWRAINGPRFCLHVEKDAFRLISTLLMRHCFTPIKNAEKAKLGEVGLDQIGLVASDDHTFEVTLAHPAPYFLYMIANPRFAPVCQSVEEQKPSLVPRSGHFPLVTVPFG